MIFRLVLVAGVALLLGAGLARADPLPSWGPGPAKSAILAFVEGVTDPGSETYVPPAERIAVFDNDGTLWSEQPFYFQLSFALDRAKTLGKRAESSPVLRAAISGDVEELLSFGKKGLLELVMATHAGMTAEAFDTAAAEWLSTARHPKTGRRYTEMVYQPMLELLAYLRAKGFKTFIVSGGGIAFIRAFSEAVYGIPPEQVLGSSVKTRFAFEDGKAKLVKEPALFFLDDKEGKPVAIGHHIGRRPIFAAGNSDGDLQMVQYTMAGPGPRFALFVHHTDDVREWAYDRESRIGHFDRALDEAKKNGWTLVDMKRDWRHVHPFELE